MSAPPETFENQVSVSIRDFAMSFPETSEGTSCVNRAFKAGKKNFVFLGEKGTQCTLRLKLGDSVAELIERSESDDRFEVGTHGWTKIVFDADQAPSSKDLEHWITESFLLLAPKKVAAQLDR